jgi:purine-cytosine permease-like protein
VLLLMILIVIVGLISGTLGQILEIAAGVAIGLILFVVGGILILSYFLRRRFRRAARDWERSHRAGPPSPYDDV